MSEPKGESAHPLFPGAVLLRQRCWAVPINSIQWWVFEPDSLQFYLHQTHGKTGYETDLQLRGDVLFIDPEDQKEQILRGLTGAQRAYLETFFGPAECFSVVSHSWRLLGWQLAYALGIPLAVALFAGGAAAAVVSGVRRETAAILAVSLALIPSFVLVWKLLERNKLEWGRKIFPQLVLKDGRLRVSETEKHQDWDLNGEFVMQWNWWATASVRGAGRTEGTTLTLSAPGKIIRISSLDGLKWAGRHGGARCDPPAQQPDLVLWGADLERLYLRLRAWLPEAKDDPGRAPR
jgi:hypothetical protein